MWNLSDVSDWFNCKTEDGNVVKISSLDYNKIVDFLNQEDFDYRNVMEYDYLCVRELYFHGAQGVTTRISATRKEDVLLISFNNSFKTYNDWILKHEIGHCNTGYEYVKDGGGRWCKKDIGDQDEREKQANLFMLKHCWDQNFIDNYIKDAKEYFENISKILSKEVNKENLKKFFEKDEDPEEYLKWNSAVVSRGIYEKLLTNIYDLTKSQYLLPDEVRNTIQEKFKNIIPTFGK